MQPSEITAETMNSASFYAAKHASHRPPRENLAPIDNVVSVIADAVPTKVRSISEVVNQISLRILIAHIPKVRDLYR